MMTLADFLGELVKDIADARTQADYHAASMSELYHADPFVKNLPIPHYIIEEAEIDVPVIVVGISQESEQFKKQKQLMTDTIKEKLPLMLLRNYKWNYITERKSLQEQKERELQSENQLREETSKKRSESTPDRDFDKFSTELLDSFSKSTKKITQNMVKHFEEYTYNYEILKLLEITEDFSRALMNQIKNDMKSYDKENVPYLSDETISNSINYIGNLMFFEFKRIMQSDSGVNIEPATGLMNEYGGKDSLMRIKFKLREQDLNLNVEDNKGKEKRYLSLT